MRKRKSGLRRNLKVDFDHLHLWKLTKLSRPLWRSGPHWPLSLEAIVEFRCRSRLTLHRKNLQDAHLRFFKIYKSQIDQIYNNKLKTKIGESMEERWSLEWRSENGPRVTKSTIRWLPFMNHVDQCLDHRLWLVSSLGYSEQANGD